MPRYLVDVMVTLEVEADDPSVMDAAVEHALEVIGGLTLRQWDMRDWTLDD